MLTKCALKSEIVQLTYRVAELEERLCPCEQHDLVETGKEIVCGNFPGEINYLHTYKCKRCGKAVKKYDWE